MEILTSNTTSAVVSMPACKSAQGQANAAAGNQSDPQPVSPCSSPSNLTSSPNTTHEPEEHSPTDETDS